LRFAEAPKDLGRPERRLQPRAGVPQNLREKLSGRLAGRFDPREKEAQIAFLVSFGPHAGFRAQTRSDMVESETSIDRSLLS
jgi:hypothetical protein